MSRDQALGFRLQCSVFSVQGLGFRVWGNRINFDDFGHACEAVEYSGVDRIWHI